MPSLLRLCSAAVCCAAAAAPTSAGNDSADQSGGDHTAKADIQTPPPPPLSSSSCSQSTLPCSFSLLATLTTTPSSASAAALAVSPPILCAASEERVVLYDLAGLRQLAAVPAVGRGSGSVKSVKFSSDGARIFTAHQDCRIRIWTVSFSGSDGNRRLRLTATLPTVSDRLCNFAFPRNYVQIRRHKWTLWNKHSDVVSSLAAGDDVDVDVLYSASWDKTIKVWRLRRCVASFPAHDDAVNAVVVSPDAAVVYTASSDSRIKVWKTKRTELALLRTLENRHQSAAAAAAAAVNALALSPDGMFLYSGGCDRLIFEWESTEYAVTAVFRGHENAVMCLATVDDLVVSGSSDRTVRIWRRGEAGRCVAVLVGHQKAVKSVAVCRVYDPHHNHHQVVEYRVSSGSVDGEVRVWKVVVDR